MGLFGSFFGGNKSSTTTDYKNNGVVGNGQWGLLIDKTLAKFRYDTRKEALVAMEDAYYIISVQVVKLDEFGTGRIIEHHEEKLEECKKWS